MEKKYNYTPEQLKEYRKLIPDFGLTKSEALKYAAKMGASDSLRVIQYGVCNKDEP